MTTKGENQLQDGLTATERANRIAVLKQGMKRSEETSNKLGEIKTNIEGSNGQSSDLENDSHEISEKSKDLLLERRRTELAELEEIEAKQKQKKIKSCQKLKLKNSDRKT